MTMMSKRKAIVSICVSTSLAVASTLLTDINLDLDDECTLGGGEQGACAFSAAQLRAQRVAVAATARQVPQAAPPAEEPESSSDEIVAAAGDSTWGDESEAAAGDAPKARFKSEGLRCNPVTGGTCFWSNCDTSRGPAVCSKGLCMCPDGTCSHGGKCVEDHSLDCGQIIPGAELRDSAWRQFEEKCKCPQDTKVSGSAPDCQKYSGSRYFSLMLRPHLCQCTGPGWYGNGGAGSTTSPYSSNYNQGGWPSYGGYNKPGTTTTPYHSYSNNGYSTGNVYSTGNSGWDTSDYPSSYNGWR